MTTRQADTNVILFPVRSAGRGEGPPHLPLSRLEAPPGPYPYPPLSPPPGGIYSPQGDGQMSIIFPTIPPHIPPPTDIKQKMVLDRILGVPGSVVGGIRGTGGTGVTGGGISGGSGVPRCFDDGSEVGGSGIGSGTGAVPVWRVWVALGLIVGFSCFCVWRVSGFVL